MTSTKDIFERIDGGLRAIESLRPQADDLLALANAIVEVFDGGGLLATAGNGGSAAQASHLAEELIGRYRGDRPPCRAVCLNSDAAALTCIANDYGFEHVFARQAEALTGPGDALVVLSTSGRSPNIVRALETARKRGAATFGLLGRDGGDCAALCNRSIIVPAQDSAHIQEAHQVIIHVICEVVERHLGG